MADRLTVARPYAKAAFASAKAAGRLDSWSGVLARAAEAVRDERVSGLFGSPKVNAEQMAGFVSGIAGSNLDNETLNFISLLAENKRLPFLPEIAQIFEQLKADAERVIDVSVTSAAPMGAGEAAALSAALAKRFDRQVRVQTAVDPSLVGGAVVRAGDLTIDGSIKARLERLSLDLTA
jgi:F-type H+-transporting ATPase subunit delta